MLLNEQLQRDTVTGLGESLKRELKQAAYPQVAQDMLMNEATRQILDLLAANEFPALLLKGTPVAHLYYPQTYLRPRCDTDIYIKECDAENVKALLEANGYEIGGELQREHASKQFTAGSRPFQHVVTTFDIHWKPSNRVLFWNMLPFGECYADKQAVPQLGENAWTLCTADLLLHACIHRIGHGRNTERNRLLWLYDIHLLWMAMDDPAREAFISKALDKKIGAVCADALEISAELFGSDVGAIALSGRDSIDDHSRAKACSHKSNSPVGAAPGRESSAVETCSDTVGAAPVETSSTTVGGSSFAAGDSARLRSQSRKEPTAKLIEASKLRWALADLAALPGLKAKFAFTRELLRL
jgi:hypothetical protein